MCVEVLNALVDDVGMAAPRKFEYAVHQAVCHVRQPDTQSVKVPDLIEIL